LGGMVMPLSPSGRTDLKTLSPIAASLAITLRGAMIMDFVPGGASMRRKVRLAIA